MDTNGVMKKYKIKIKNPVMGVPITFLDKYCPTQFRIVGLLCDNRCGNPMLNGTPTYTDEKHKNSVCGVLKGKRVYPRVIIQKI